jgi:hypothetical protein
MEIEINPRLLEKGLSIFHDLEHLRSFVYGRAQSKSS